MVGVVTQRGRVGLLALIVGIAIAATSWSSAQAAIFDVAAQDNAFKPQVITINPGDTVIWTNFDAIDHVVQSKVALLFFRPLPSGQIATIAFLSPGVYEYEDPAHDGMIGTIIVRGPSPTASATATNPPSPTASATVTPSPTATQVVNLPSATAPPSPTATTTAVSSPTRAPGPPNTGSGVRDSGESNTPMIILAIGLCLSVAMGSGVIARRARPRS